jgi:hypothetical protein
VNTASLPDHIIGMVYITCLGVLHCPMTIEEKTKTLESELKRFAEDGHSLTAVQTGLEPFDKAVMDYALQLEATLTP